MEELVKQEHAKAFEELKQGVEDRLARETALIRNNTLKQLEPTFKLTIAYSRALEKIGYEEPPAKVDGLVGPEQAMSI